MNWARDASGRFLRRPYYSTQEMETQCETLIVEHLATRHGSVQFPVSTDDLTVLVETLVDDLDLFADLSREGNEVEGVTDFFSERRPRIRIERSLSTNPRMFNRLRTTLTHELGHVVFHKIMFDGPRTASLFELSPGAVLSNACKRDKILDGTANRLDGVAGRVRVWRIPDATRSAECRDTPNCRRARTSCGKVQRDVGARDRVDCRHRNSLRCL